MSWKLMKIPLGMTETHSRRIQGVPGGISDWTNDKLFIHSIILVSSFSELRFYDLFVMYF